MRRLLPLLFVLAAAVAPAAAHAANPEVSWRCNGSPDCHDVWFTSPVSLDWTVAGATSTEGCDDVTITQDTAANLQGCIAYNGPVKVDVTLKIKLDQTAPVVTDA